MLATRSFMASLRSTKTANSWDPRRTPTRRSGAYWWAAATAPLFWSLMLVPSVYDVQAIDLTTQRRVHQHRADFGLSRRRAARRRSI